MRKDGRADMRELKVSFRNIAIIRKKRIFRCASRYLLSDYCKELILLQLRI